jgi:Sucrase/ferredoxin-like
MTDALIDEGPAPLPAAAGEAAAGEAAAAALPGCATVMRLLGGDPAGTATRMRTWLLIEQPGPWPADALERVLDSALDRAGRERLDRLVADHGLRPLLIRRPGQHPRNQHGGRRTVLVGSAAPGRRWLETLELDDLSELATLDLDAITRGGGLGRPVSGPVFLICTHGTKDLCCAVLGRPLAAALAADHPERAWETSHVGGDRWAGNLLVVPDGIMHGHLTAGEAARVAKAALDGEVEPDHLRGRTIASPQAQAAEVAVRRRSGLRGLDEVVALGERSLARPLDAGAGEDGQAEADGWAVTVRAGDERLLVTVRRRALGAGGTSRCAGLLMPSSYMAEEIGAAPPSAEAIDQAGDEAGDRLSSP